MAKILPPLNNEHHVVQCSCSKEKALTFFCLLNGVLIPVICVHHGECFLSQSTKIDNHEFKIGWLWNGARRIGSNRVSKRANERTSGGMHHALGGNSDNINKSSNDNDTTLSYHWLTVVRVVENFLLVRLQTAWKMTKMSHSWTYVLIPLNWLIRSVDSWSCFLNWICHLTERILFSIS